jgi:ABC-2 type transport system ATP-binding protein
MATTYMDEAERASAVHILDRGRVLLSGTSTDLIAQMPGQVTESDTPSNPPTAWRVGTAFHQWWPDGAPFGTDAGEPTLEDVAIVARLRASMVSTGIAP